MVDVKEDDTQGPMTRRTTCHCQCPGGQHARINDKGDNMLWLATRRLHAVVGDKEGDGLWPVTMGSCARTNDRKDDMPWLKMRRMTCCQDTVPSETH